MIEKGNIALEMQEIMDSSHLEAFEDIKILAKCKSPDEFKIIVEETASVKLDLMKIIQENGVYPIDKIRKIQKFFNDAGTPYLSRAYNLLRRSEKCKSYYI